MKFKLDENLGQSAREPFTRRGHDCETVRDEGLGGADDPAVLAAAIAEDRVLATMDHDFGNVLSYQPKAPGIVVLNLPGRASRGMMISLLESLLTACTTNPLRGSCGSWKQVVYASMRPHSRCHSCFSLG